MTGYGDGPIGSGPFGIGGGTVVASAAIAEPVPQTDRYGLGPYGRRYHMPNIAIPTLYTDRYGFGCYGRREGVPFVPIGRTLTQTCYCTIGRIGCSGSVLCTEAGEIPPAVAIVLPKLRAPVVYVLDENLQPLAVIDGYESFEWQERWREPDEWALSVNMHVAGATALATGTFVAAPMPNGETLVGLIEGIAGGVSEEGIPSEIVTASGRDYGATLEGRIAMMETKAGDGYDGWTTSGEAPTDGHAYWMKTGGNAAEAMCHFVWHNVIGDSINPVGDRQIPGLAIGTVPHTAETIQYRARFQSLTEILMDIGLATGLGWRVRYAEPGFLFEPRIGRDMTREVAFSPEYGNVASIGFSHDTRNERSIAYVAGQGEGADRNVLPYYAEDRYTPGDLRGGKLAWREIFVDARDIDLEDTATAPDALRTRGLAKLAEASPEQSIEFALLDGGAYSYPEDFQNGDVVRVEYPGWAYEESRIVAVSQRWDRNGKTVSVAVGQEARDVGTVIVGLSRMQGVRSRT